MSWARRWLPRLWAPLTALNECRWQGRSFRILTYHRVCAHRPGDRLCVTPEAFAAQLAWLRARNWTVLSLTAALAGFKNGRWPQRAVVLTFDDGYVDNYSLAYPRLQQCKFPATIYITTAWTGRPGAIPDCAGGDERDRALSLDELRILNAERLVGLGSHTVSHSRLSRLSPTELEFELVESRRSLSAAGGNEILDLAYPKGDHDPQVVQAAAAAGYRSAVTTRPGRNTAATPPLELRRTEISGADTRGDFARKLAGAFDPWHRYLDWRLRRASARNLPAGGSGGQV